MNRATLLVFWLLGCSWVVAAAEPTIPPRFQVELRQVLEQLPPHPLDPNEPINRKMFLFNAWLVENVVDPTANWLEHTLPEIAKQAGYNIYSNLVEPEFILTNTLVGNYEAAKTSAKRFLLNSTIGIAGLWDPAEKMGYQRTETEFTESLCVAGLDPGNFVILPVVGPASSHSAMLLTGFFAVEWYLLSHISPTIATADLVIDISASAASLRYARDVPNSDTKDPYLIQRADYQNYLWPRCSSHLEKRLAAPSAEIALNERQPSPQ
ncbi:phospholipid-binding lipoprotein MlaA [Gammaproteobacteria bacterium]